MRFYLYLFCSFFFITCNAYHPLKTEGEVFSVEDGRDSLLASVMEPYRDSLLTILNDQVAVLDEIFYHRQPCGDVGNLIADAVYKKAFDLSEEQIDFSVYNFYGIRVPLIDSGGVTLGELYEVIPFDNSLVVVELDSAGVHTLFKKIAGLGGWPVSENVKASIAGDRLHSLIINGKKLEDRKYRIATIDYLVHGGDDMEFLKDYNVEYLNELSRDALIDYLKKTERPVKKSYDCRMNYAHR